LEVFGNYTGRLKEGYAIHIVGDNECILENAGSKDAVYNIICGGHSAGGHH